MAFPLMNVFLEGTYEATILVGDSPDAYNDVEHPERVVPEKTQLAFKQGVVRLPPFSLTIVRNNIGRCIPRKDTSRESHARERCSGTILLAEQRRQTVHGPGFDRRTGRLP